MDINEAVNQAINGVSKNLEELTHLTIEDLKGMKPGEMFASGKSIIEHPWFNHVEKTKLDSKKTVVNWVAIRGGIHDWAIYHSLDANLEPARYLDGVKHLEATNEQIARAGAKMHKDNVIKKLVPCTDEAFKMYRH